MTVSHVCLSPWQIDLAELFCNRRLRHTTAEHVCRLESFLHAYCLFDCLFIPEKYRQSSFIAALDPQRNIFSMDSEVPGSFSTNSEGQAVVEVNPGLLFKNEPHLKPKSMAWLEQHLTFDIPRRQRENLRGELQHFDTSAALFYKLILAEYDTMWALAIRNDAFSALFASVFQIYWPDVREIPQFLAYLQKQARRAKLAPLSGPAGIVNFELPTGALEARLAVPALLETFLDRARHEDPYAALRSTRQSYESCRVEFRSLAHAFKSSPDSEQVVSQMSGPAISRWNDYVRNMPGSARQALLLRSNVAAIQLDFEPMGADFLGALRERIQAIAPVLRLAPYQSFSPGTSSGLDLSPLHILDVLPFRRRLFRMGRAYRNKRSLAHQGLGAFVSFPLYIDCQLPQASLNDCTIRDRPAHLYLICTRPRITVCPDVRVHRDWIEMEIWFEQKTTTECERIAFEHPGVRGAIVDPRKRTHVLFHDQDGNARSCDVSLIYQSLVQSTLGQRNPAALLTETGEVFPAQLTAKLERTDLRVIYIGQSQGRDLQRTAITRLNGHEKWGLFEGYLRDNPHEELWILLLGQHPPQHLNMTILSRPGNDQDAAELLQRAASPPAFGRMNGINFIEAALIHHFRPRFNKTFTRGCFPSRNHSSYERFFTHPIDLAAIELDTWESIGCRLYSERVPPRFFHMKKHQLNPAFSLNLPAVSPGSFDLSSGGLT